MSLLNVADPVLFLIVYRDLVQHQGQDTEVLKLTNPAKKMSRSGNPAVHLQPTVTDTRVR